MCYCCFCVAPGNYAGKLLHTFTIALLCHAWCACVCAPDVRARALGKLFISSLNASHNNKTPHSRYRICTDVGAVISMRSLIMCACMYRRSLCAAFNRRSFCNSIYSKPICHGDIQFTIERTEVVRVHPQLQSSAITTPAPPPTDWAEQSH